MYLGSKHIKFVHLIKLIYLASHLQLTLTYHVSMCFTATNHNWALYIIHFYNLQNNSTTKYTLC